MTNIHEDDFGGAFLFESKYRDMVNGRMAYIDEGEGEPVVTLRGNPTASITPIAFFRKTSRKPSRD